MKKKSELKKPEPKKQTLAKQYTVPGKTPYQRVPKRLK